MSKLFEIGVIFFLKKGPDDADYVQVVHTDGFARGVLAASGHQDFYMVITSNGDEQHSIRHYILNLYFMNM